MTRYTPGPWEVMHKTSEGHRLVGDDTYGFIKVDKICDGLCGRGDMEANACLIASAPELLDACKESLKYFKSIEKCVTDSEELGEVKFNIVKLEEAITKAEGK